jgi:type I restriction enzyme, S subunit
MLNGPAFPEDWPRRPIYELATWTNGLAFRDFQFSDSGWPVIKIAELKEGVSGQTKFTRQTFDERYHVKNGDMLFSWSGNPDTSLDVFWWRRGDGWLNQHIFKVEPTYADRGFFYYLLRYLRPTFGEIAGNKQTTGLGHVTAADLKSLFVGVPPMQVQRGIARILGSLDDKIELNLRMNQTLEQIAQALFKSWFVDFDPVRAKAEGRWKRGASLPGLPADMWDLWPSKFEESELGEVPKGWEVKPFSSAVEVNPERRLAKGEVAPYVEMSQLPTSSARVAGWVNRPFASGSRFRNGDVLVARITPCLENGKTAYVDFLSDSRVGWGSTEFLVLSARSPLPSQWTYCLARTEDFRMHLIQNMTGTSGRQRAPAECLGSFVIAIPTSEVAERFGQVVAPWFANLKVNDRESSTLADARDALLPKLLSGEIRVPVNGSV